MSFRRGWPASSQGSGQEAEKITLEKDKAIADQAIKKHIERHATDIELYEKQQEKLAKAIADLKISRSEKLALDAEVADLTGKWDRALELASKYRQDKDNAESSLQACEAEVKEKDNMIAEINGRMSKVLGTGPPGRTLSSTTRLMEQQAQQLQQSRQEERDQHARQLEQMKATHDALCNDLRTQVHELSRERKEAMAKVSGCEIALEKKTNRCEKLRAANEKLMASKKRHKASLRKSDRERAETLEEIQRTRNDKNQLLEERDQAVDERDQAVAEKNSATLRAGSLLTERNQWQDRCGEQSRMQSPQGALQASRQECSNLRLERNTLQDKLNRRSKDIESLQNKNTALEASSLENTAKIDRLKKQQHKY